MPSINKSISIVLLVGAASNVLAAPFKDATAVVESDPCVVKATETTVMTILGVADRLLDSKKYPEGCSEEQTRKCAAKETPADKEHAEKYCPKIKDCPSDMVSQVWKSCWLEPVKSSADQDEGLILGMGKDLPKIVVPVISGTVDLGNGGKDKDGKGKDGKDDKGKDGKDKGGLEVGIPGKDGKDGKKDGKDTNVGVDLPGKGNLPGNDKGSDGGKKDTVGVDVNVNGDDKKGSKDSKGADVTAEVDLGKDEGCPCASKNPLIKAEAKAAY
ncbi:hypothetical protein AAF712_007790 [Marasmius tenuissimus]|uniref:Uncharacterized protein n=1 Tax=Marasmius tenuissimus TaxID=585030 RepID=A0ABR2ZVA1_9AGAR|nr:hypothetical protein PM082_015777 [Marasmius tenuissimus]